MIKQLFWMFGRVFLAGSLLFAASCAKPLAPVDPDAPTGDGDFVDVLFSLSEDAEETKVSGVTDVQETQINRYALVVFDDDSGWVGWQAVSSSASVTIKLRAGRDYTVYAVVNYPTSGSGVLNPSGVRTPSDLTNKIAYLSDNAVGSLLMYGYNTVTPAAVVYDPATDGSFVAADPQEVVVHVSRLVSRVDVTQVAVDFSAKPHLEGKTFILKNIYLTNIYRSSRYSSDYGYTELSALRTAWYNTGGFHRGESAVTGMDALVSDMGIDHALSSSAPYTTMRSFYCYPNPTAKAGDVHTMGAWTKRCTRIIIECLMDGDTMYYQIDVPSMERNRIYSVSNVVIRGKGSKDPEVIDYWDDDVDFSYDIVTSEWDGTYNVSENS